MIERSLHRLIYSASEHRSLLTRWTARAGFTLVDQAALSGANFAFSLFLVRKLTADAYGYYSLALTVFAIVLGFYSALVLEPLGVLGAVKDGDSVHDYLAQLFWLQLGVSAVLSVVVALSVLLFRAGELASSLMLLAVVLPAALLGYGARRACYLNGDARTAAVSSASYAIVLLALAVIMYEVGILSAATAWLAVAGATLVSSALPWRRLGVCIRWPQLRPLDEGLRDVVSAHWRYGKWLLVTAVLAIASQQTPYLLAAHFDGVATAGQLRASVLFIVPGLQVMISLGFYLILPVMARSANHHGYRVLHKKTCIITVGFLIFSFGYASVLILFRDVITDVVLAGRTPEAARLLPVLVLWPVAAALGSGFVLALRAAEKTKFFPISSVVTAIVGVISITSLTMRWGVMGAAISTVITVASMSVVAGLLYVRWIYRQIDEPPPQGRAVDS